MISRIIRGRFSFVLFVGLVLFISSLLFPCSVYVELADQYKVMDAVSDVPRRNLLARHLREVVDILELKVSPTQCSSVGAADAFPLLLLGRPNRIPL